MLITAKNIRKEYQFSKENIVTALNGVDLEIKEGEFVAIIGPSGSGKSTLLNILGTLDPPDSGDLFIGGLNIGELKNSQLPYIRGHKIGFIFQEFNLIPTLTALENVMLGLRYLGVKKSEAKERALEALDQVGLVDRVNHKPRQLSGGQQQRVAIARVLVKEPAFILGDEPTGELDTHTTDEIMNLLKKINKEKGITLIIVTHNIEVAKQANRIIKVVDGKVEKA